MRLGFFNWLAEFIPLQVSIVQRNSSRELLR